VPAPRPARPLVLQLHDLEFADLDRTRVYLERILDYARNSLEHFYDSKSGGFFHLVDPDVPGAAGDFSKASTGTCLAFLKRSGLFEGGDWEKKANDLRGSMIRSDWQTADLPKGNVFTSAFLLEAIHALGGRTNLTDSEARSIRRRSRKLKADLISQGGGLQIQGYPATAFLTHKAVRTLDLWAEIDQPTRDCVTRWTWNHLQEESVLVASGSPDADVFEIAYSVLVATQLTPINQMTPQQRSLLGYTVDQFFAGQNEVTGTWPRSRPLFHYPRLGNAYCFDYELLVPMLADRQLLPFMFKHLRRLIRAAEVLDATKFPLRPEGIGWASGHHGRSNRAESWSHCFGLPLLLRTPSRSCRGNSAHCVRLSRRGIRRS
jgi:hypothetical protein